MASTIVDFNSFVTAEDIAHAILCTTENRTFFAELGKSQDAALRLRAIEYTSSLMKPDASLMLRVVVLIRKTFFCNNLRTMSEEVVNLCVKFTKEL